MGDLIEIKGASNEAAKEREEDLVEVLEAATKEAKSKGVKAFALVIIFADESTSRWANFPGGGQYPLIGVLWRLLARLDRHSDEAND